MVVRDGNGVVMARYRIHFIGQDGKVFDAIELERDIDDAAIEEARRLDVPSVGAGFDLWLEERLVYRHRR